MCKQEIGKYRRYLVALQFLNVFPSRDATRYLYRGMLVAEYQNTRKHKPSILDRNFCRIAHDLVAFLSDSIRRQNKLAGTTLPAMMTRR